MVTVPAGGSSASAAPRTGSGRPLSSSHGPLRAAAVTPVNRVTEALVAAARPETSRSRTMTPSSGRGWLAAGDSGLPRGFSADTQAVAGSAAARLAVAGSGPSCRDVSQASRSWL